MIVWDGMDGDEDNDDDDDDEDDEEEEEDEVEVGGSIPAEGKERDSMD